MTHKKLFDFKIEGSQQMKFHMLFDMVSHLYIMKYGFERYGDLVKYYSLVITEPGDEEEVTNE